MVYVSDRSIIRYLAVGICGLVGLLVYLTSQPFFNLEGWYGPVLLFYLAAGTCGAGRLAGVTGQSALPAQVASHTRQTVKSIVYLINYFFGGWVGRVFILFQIIRTHGIFFIFFHP